MRGNLVICRIRTGQGGSIPAHAGEPPLSAIAANASRVYPRACGGTAATSFGPERPSWVYPRACGGTEPGDYPGPPLAGLSPRMRGNHVPARRPIRIIGGSIPAHAGEPVLNRNLPVAATGSIPAHAGEPRSRSGIVLISRVYPRACGGTRPELLNAELLRSGLSPRMRGNPGRRDECQVRPGSIPAHAGEPTYAQGRRAIEHGSIPAHAGEPATRPDLLPGDVEGLSPRMRGNREDPAGCGRRNRRVYPRACGGTVSGSASRAIQAGGLSPRMRGNPL